MLYNIFHLDSEIYVNEKKKVSPFFRGSITAMIFFFFFFLIAVVLLFFMTENSVWLHFDMEIYVSAQILHCNEFLKKKKKKI